MQLTKSSHSILCVEARSRRKILKPKRGRPPKVVLGGKSSPSSYGPKSPSAAIRETRSATAQQKAVSPLSSSDGVEIMKEVSTPTSVSIGGPRTCSHKRLVLMDEEEEEESRELLVCRARKKARR